MSKRIILQLLVLSAVLVLAVGNSGQIRSEYHTVLPSDAPLEEQHLVARGLLHGWWATTPGLMWSGSYMPDEELWEYLIHTEDAVEEVLRRGLAERGLHFLSFERAALALALALVTEQVSGLEREAATRFQEVLAGLETIQQEISVATARVATGAVALEETIDFYRAALCDGIPDLGDLSLARGLWDLAQTIKDYLFGHELSDFSEAELYGVAIDLDLAAATSCELARAQEETGGLLPLDLVEKVGKHLIETSQPFLQRNVREEHAADAIQLASHNPEDHCPKDQYEGCTTYYTKNYSEPRCTEWHHFIGISTPIITLPEGGLWARLCYWQVKIERTLVRMCYKSWWDRFWACRGFNKQVDIRVTFDTEARIQYKLTTIKPEDAPPSPPKEPIRITKECF